MCTHQVLKLVINARQFKLNINKSRTGFSFVLYRRASLWQRVSLRESLVRAQPGSGQGLRQSPGHALPQDLLLRATRHPRLRGTGVSDVTDHSDIVLVALVSDVTDQYVVVYISRVINVTDQCVYCDVMLL